MSTELDMEFEEAFKIASNMTHQLPQDVMLNFYAYYKQATSGDNFSFSTNQGVRDGFKFNAWMQLRGLDKDEAKRRYIKLVKKYSK